MIKLHISKGNRKMGSIPSVSFPPIVTCRKCDCWKKCYANKHIYIIYKQSKNAYDENLELYKNNPGSFFMQLEAEIMTDRTFRFNVAGDIPDYEYFLGICEIMKRNPHCEAIIFTKKFEIVNQYLDLGGVIPDNFHVIFSAWKNLEMINPHELPECHIAYSDGTTTAKDGAKFCSGNCTECFCQNKGCFNLKKGEQILIQEH